MKALCERIVSAQFACLPFRGEKPFEVVRRESCTANNNSHNPQALVSQELFLDETKTYQVVITCSQDEYNRFVFQYAHELAHFYMTPYCHPFLEVCAVAVSLSTLTHCGQEWERLGKLPASYAAKFEAYRNRVEMGSEVALGALLAKEVLDSSSNWRPLTTLAKCLRDENTVDFEKWLAMNKQLEGSMDDYKFANRVVELFAETFDKVA